MQYSKLRNVNLPNVTPSLIPRNPSVVSPTLNVNPTLFVIPCNFFGRLQIYNVAITITYKVHPNFNHPWPYFITSCWHDKRRWDLGQWMNSSIIHDSICKPIHTKCHPKSYDSDTKHRMTLNMRLRRDDMSAVTPVTNSDIGKCVQNIKRRSMAEDDDWVHKKSIQGLGFNFDFVTAHSLPKPIIFTFPFFFIRGPWCRICFTCKRRWNLEAKGSLVCQKSSLLVKSLSHSAAT